jgi:hypothetical protein
VSPDEGCNVVLGDEEANRWRQWRTERDVRQDDGKPFVDRQLLRAVECVEKEAAKRIGQKP